jgi:hypothetical protein
MKRIIIICEGQTEQAFCKRVLSPYFIEKKYNIQTPVIKHTRGGIVKWEILKKQIETHLITERDAYVTTLIDYYGLYDKHYFPSWQDAKRIVDRSERVKLLENGMKNNIDDNLRHRFIPYMQLHEFEGLLFNDISIFYEQIPKRDLIGVEELKKTFSDYNNPEMINDTRETSPSHRLKRIIAGYNKVVYGEILAKEIGLHRIRQKSPRFNNWINHLENI